MIRSGKRVGLDAVAASAFGLYDGKKAEHRSLRPEPPQSSFRILKSSFEIGLEDQEIGLMGKKVGWYMPMPSKGPTYILRTSRTAGPP